MSRLVIPATPLPPYWSPVGSNFDAWWDFSDITTITKQSGTNYVQQIDDKMGSNHLSNSTASEQPLYVENELNGLNVAQFDGTDDILLIRNSSSLIISLGGGFTIIGIGETYTSGNYTNTFFSTRYGENGMMVYLYGDGNNIGRIYHKTENDWVNNNYPDVPYPTRIIASVWSDLRNGGYMESLANDGSVSTTFTEDPVPNPYGDFSIGALVNKTNNGYIKIGEVLYAKTLLSESERQKAEGYLAWKWGMVDKLPASHPYKNERPSS